MRDVVQRCQDHSAEEDLDGEVFDEYTEENAYPSSPLVNAGEEYVSKNVAMPTRFCGWAWADTQKDIARLATGGDFPWIREK
jgi:hypothetical protein